MKKKTDPTKAFCILVKIGKRVKYVKIVSDDPFKIAYNDYLSGAELYGLDGMDETIQLLEKRKERYLVQGVILFDIYKKDKNGER